MWQLAGYGVAWAAAALEIQLEQWLGASSATATAAAAVLSAATTGGSSRSGAFSHGGEPVSSFSRALAVAVFAGS